MSMFVWPRKLLAAAASLLLVAFSPVANFQPAAQAAAPSAQHYLYHCPGYNYDQATQTYTLPTDCQADPNQQPSVHTWMTYQGQKILRGDGQTRLANFLDTRVARGRGQGRTHLDLLIEGVITADTGLVGCTRYGRDHGWVLGDHELNPYRHFGIWSNNASRAPGWQGTSFAASQGRTVGQCANSPRVRSNSARMADEFSGRAVRAWQSGQTGEAMFSLGVALHLVQDANVPSHAHPEVDVTSLTVTKPNGQPAPGIDAFPAWSDVNKEQFAVNSGGQYQLPTEFRGVRIVNTAGGRVYMMAATTYPHAPFDSATSAVGANRFGCDVTDFPEQCRSVSGELLRVGQRASAAMLWQFFATVRY